MVAAGFILGGLLGRLLRDGAAIGSCDGRMWAICYSSRCSLPRRSRKSMKQFQRLRLRSGIQPLHWFSSASSRELLPAPRDWRRVGY
jgi:hypothetical protein